MLIFSTKQRQKKQGVSSDSSVFEIGCSHFRYQTHVATKQVDEKKTCSLLALNNANPILISQIVFEVEQFKIRLNIVSQPEAQMKQIGNQYPYQISTYLTLSLFVEVFMIAYVL